MKGCPRRPQPIRHAPGITDERRSARLLVDAHHHPVAGWPRSRNGMSLHVRQKLLINALCRTAKGKLTKCRQIARRKIMIECPPRRLGDIDLAFFEPLDEVVRGDVDDLNIV